MAFNPHARDRYLRLMTWARRRYTKNGVLVLRVGTADAVYLQIEKAAFRKFFRA